MTPSGLVVLFALCFLMVMGWLLNAWTDCGYGCEQAVERRLHDYCPGDSGGTGVKRMILWIKAAICASLTLAVLCGPALLAWLVGASEGIVWSLLVGMVLFIGLTVAFYAGFSDLKEYGRR